MLPLTSPRWATLAPELPDLPEWLARLCEQGTVAWLADRLRVSEAMRPVAYAVLPHLLAALGATAGSAALAALAVRIELARQRPDPPAMPADLAEDYEAARAQLVPTCVSLAVAHPEAVPAAAAAVALSAGAHILAEAYFELTLAEADSFLLWVKTR